MYDTTIPVSISESYADKLPNCSSMILPDSAPCSEKKEEKKEEEELLVLNQVPKNQKAQELHSTHVRT